MYNILHFNKTKLVSPNPVRRETDRAVRRLLKVILTIVAYCSESSFLQRDISATVHFFYTRFVPKLKVK